MLDLILIYWVSADRLLDFFDSIVTSLKICLFFASFVCVWGLSEDKMNLLYTVYRVLVQACHFLVSRPM